MANVEAEPRILLVAVDDTDDSERAFSWALNNIVRSGDSLHFCHVVPRVQLGAYGFVPPMDLPPVLTDNTEAHKVSVDHAERFIAERFLTKLPLGSQSQLSTTVHIVKSEVDSQSVGQVLCKKAEELNAACLVIASHNKGKLAELFLGSVTQYCTHHSKTPLAIIR